MRTSLPRRQLHIRTSPPHAAAPPIGCPGYLAWRRQIRPWTAKSSQGDASRRPAKGSKRMRRSRDPAARAPSSPYHVSPRWTLTPTPRSEPLALNADAARRERFAAVRPPRAGRTPTPTRFHGAKRSAPCRLPTAMPPLLPSSSAAHGVDSPCSATSSASPDRRGSLPPPPPEVRLASQGEVRSPPPLLRAACTAGRAGWRRRWGRAGRRIAARAAWVATRGSRVNPFSLFS